MQEEEAEKSHLTCTQKEESELELWEGCKPSKSSHSNVLPLVILNLLKVTEPLQTAPLTEFQIFKYVNPLSLFLIQTSIIPHKMSLIFDII